MGRRRPCITLASQRLEPGVKRRPDLIRLVGQASLADVPESMLANKRVLVRVDFNVPQVLYARNERRACPSAAGTHT